LSHCLGGRLPEVPGLFRVPAEKRDRRLQEARGNAVRAASAETKELTPTAIGSQIRCTAPSCLNSWLFESLRSLSIRYGSLHTAIGELICQSIYVRRHGYPSIGKFTQQLPRRFTMRFFSVPVVSALSATLASAAFAGDACSLLSSRRALRHASN
jgi:hypothetical protein